jgi:iron complex outermembrane receptor protein
MDHAHYIRLAAGASLLAIGLAPVSAQTMAGADAAAPAAVAAASVDPAAPGDPSELGDIIVTGEKHDAPIQSTPLAITAIAGTDLLQRNINQLNDLNGYVPGLNIAKSEGAERIITIRGIGYETAQNPNSQPGVAFHIDGVYIAHVIALNQDLLDVERIEVLRGPQGTVFGETSTGGAINVITNKPVIGEASGTGSISYGNYNYLKGMGTVNIPVSDTIALRAAVQYLRHDPYGYATEVPGYKRYGLDDADDLGLRAALLWKPTDRFSLLLEGQYFDADRAAALQKDITDPAPNPRDVTQDYGGYFRMHTAMVYLTMQQQLGDVATLKSVSAYQWLSKHQTGDNDRLASPYYFDNLVLWEDESKTFTQELSLSSMANKSFEWTLGGFFLRQRALQNIFETTIPSAAAAVLPDGTGVKFQTDSPYQHTSIAGYGQGTAHLSDQFSLIAGLRYTHDKITAQPYQYFAVIPPRTAKSSALTGKLSVEYQFTPSNMVYATGSRGYKPTGLTFSNGGLLVPTHFEKESVWAAEIGAKNDFLNKRVRLNIAGYYYWYKNFQYTADDPIPFSGGTANIPKAEIYGFEAEGSVLPFAGFRLDGNISLGKGTFKGHYLTIDAQTAALVRSSTYAAIGYPAAYYYDPRVIGAVVAAEQDVNGKRLPKMPGVQGTASATYAWNIAGGKVTLRGDMIYRGAFNYRLFGVTALDRVPAYTVFNASLSYVPDAKPWAISVSAVNLTDKLGINSKFSDPYGSGTTSVEYIDPRQVFGTLSFKW